MKQAAKWMTYDTADWIRAMSDDVDNPDTLTDIPYNESAQDEISRLWDLAVQCHGTPQGPRIDRLCELLRHVGKFSDADRLERYWEYDLYMWPPKPRM